jgi:hypothetical protein
MRVELANKEKISMLFLGKCLDGTVLDFYYDTEPIEVGLEMLTEDQRNQLLYNCRRGALKVDNIEELTDSAKGLPAASNIYTTLAENPIGRVKDPVKLMAEKLEANRTELRNLLKEKIDIIKKKTKDMSLGQVKVLLAIEKDWKNRKAVVSLLEEKVNKYTREVLNLTGAEDIAGMTHNPTMDKLAEKFKVTESEIEEIEIRVGDEEQAR